MTRKSGKRPRRKKRIAQVKGKTRARPRAAPISQELAHELRLDLVNPADPGFNVWATRDARADPDREPGPFSPHRQPRGPAWLGIPTFFKLPIALTPDDLRAGKVDVAIFGAPLDMGIGMRR